MKKGEKKMLNAAELAVELGVDRSTITRLHSRNRIAECKVWAQKPQPHRLYDVEEVAAARAALKPKAPDGVKLIKGRGHRGEARPE